MSQPFIGEIRIFAGNFAPNGWAFCQGQLQAIAQNNALFALLGTIYGGDGQTTFALPDLRGRAAVHQGQGPGLSNYAIGQQYGTEQVTLLSAHMPAHTHIAGANSAPASTSAPDNAVWAAATGGLAYASAPGVSMNSASVTSAGGSQPHNNMSPYLALNYIIALFGVFPSRN